MKNMFTPLTKNIVFFDTEFSSLDPYIGEILSLGMVSLDGRELYLELEYEGKSDPWVEKHILPTLTGKKVKRETAIKKVTEFIGKKRPYLVSFVNQYDSVYLYKLFVDNDLPFRWVPIDFASILFGFGINPERYSAESNKPLFSDLGIDVTKYHIHNALDDAKLLREVYVKLLEKGTENLK